jgi:hypothetical protein
MESESMSLLVPEHSYSRVMTKLRRLVKKAGTTLAEVPGETVLVRRTWHDFGEPVCIHGEIVTGRWETETQHLRRVTVGPLNAVANWKLVGRVEDHMRDLGANMVLAAPGELMHERYRTAAPNCAHCGLKRQRKNTYVLRYTGPATKHPLVGELHPGDQVQIGRNCLADFIGGSPDELIAHAEMTDFFARSDDEDSWGGVWRKDSETLDFVAYALRACELDGFRPRNQPGCTANTVAFAMGLPPNPRYSTPDAVERWKQLQPNTTHYEQAQLVRDWARALEPGASDYLHNLRLALLLPTVARNGGLLASAPKAYGAAQVKLQPKSERKPSHYVGELHERLQIQARLVSRHGYDGMWGGGVAVKFEMDTGAQLVWFCSGRCPWSDTDVGKVVQLQGTVKKHQADRDGKPQTILTRVTEK